ncbi:uncharacterized protein LOC111047750 [Nilaparvata lugens]|uniref:uncharacterized protein LOC111047750 n=1 Tax=Nilaparvata lugens TaxID=108931 RepID=UPI00193E3FC4|nr:uncharacterized protein LOC111047750 [Nilaparvata lugens]XP_039290254.1 uncharacterized protein LOC111047750 [Nilaparvata lugens]XP_039290255.1 uncharacterized protein LOC111047750 [Nilaparvata lugens]
MAEQGQPVECMPSIKIPGRRPGSFVYGDGRGYYYHSEKVRAKLRMMKCIERRTMGCRARAVMRVEEGSPIMLTQASRSHNHQPDDVKGETIAMLATLKERAKKEEELRISEILDQEIVSYPKAAFAVTRKNARRAMYRMRSRVEPVRAALTSEQMGEEEMQQSYGDCTTTKEPHSDDSEATMSTVWEEIVQPDGEGLETTTTVWQEILQPDDEGMAEQGQPVECMPSMKIPGRRPGSFVYGDGRGYYYHSERIRSKLRMMKCIERRTMGCRARAVMRVEEGSPIMLTQASRSHNHRPDDVKGETKALLATLKERAKEEEELGISEIFDQEAVSYPKAAFAVTRQNARRAMQRMRSRVEPVCSALTSEQMGEEILQHSYGDCTTTKVKEEVLQTHSEDLETTVSTVWEEIVQTDGEGLETITVWEELLQSGSEDLGTTNVRAEILHPGSEGLESTNASEEILDPGSESLGTINVRAEILQPGGKGLGKASVRAEIVQPSSGGLDTTKVRAEILRPGSECLTATKVMAERLQPVSKSLATTKVREQYFIVDLPISGDAGETVASKQVVIILSLPHNHGNLSSN